MEKTTILIAVVTLASITALLVFAYTSLTKKNSSLSETFVRVGDTRVAVEIADTMISRSRGLSYRDSLEEGRGMLFQFPYPQSLSFWMHEMRFAIDIIWIHEGKIIGIERNAEPEPSVSMWNLKRYTSPSKADQVLEVPTGYSDVQNWSVGDSVVIK